MRSVSSWIWISVVAAGLLGSGLVGLFGCPRPEQVWSALEIRLGPTQAAQASVPAAAPAAGSAAPTVIDPNSVGVDAAVPPPAPDDAASAAAASDPATAPADAPSPAAPDAAPAAPLAPLPATPGANSTAASPAPAASAASPAPAVSAASASAPTVAAAPTAAAAAAPVTVPAPLPPHPLLRVPLRSTTAPSNIHHPHFVVVHRTYHHPVDDANPTAHALVVEVLPEARIAGESVQLDDIVRLHAPAGMTVPSIANVEVARISRQSARSIAINRPLIRQTLVNQGIDMGKAVFIGADAARILPVRNVVQTHDLMRVAHDYLMSELTGEYGWHKADIIVRPIQELESVVVGPGRLVIEASRLDDRRPLGAVGINLDLKLNGDVVKTVRASFQVQVMGRVVEARHGVAVGNVIASDDVRLVQRDLGSLPEGVVTHLAEVVGKVTQWTLRPGMILTEGMAVVPPVVTQNASVTIHYQSGNVQMTLVGRALKEGQKGDIIPVKSVDTGKVFDAIVVDRENVEVGPDPAVSYRPAKTGDPQRGASAPPDPRAHAVAPGTTVIAPSGPMPLWAPSAHYSEQRLPARSAAVSQNAPRLPGPNYVNPQSAPNPYARMKAALGEAHHADRAMFDLRQKPLPLH